MSAVTPPDFAPAECPIQLETAKLPQAGVNATQSAVVIGLLCGAAAMLCYAMLETVSKLLADDYHPTQILLLRCLAGLGLGVVLARSRGGWQVLRTGQPLVQASRAMAGSISMLIAIFAYSAMPLADAVAIVYSAPIAVTILVVPMLGEKIGWHRGFAVILGFVGVALVAQPGAQGVSVYTGIALVSMLLYALSNVLTRMAGSTDRGITTFWYTQIAFLILTGPIQFWVWKTPDWQAWLLLGGFAIGGALAQYLITQAYSLAPASLVAPMDYTTIIWASLFGLLVFGTMPNALGWWGIALICASGLYIALREAKLPPIRNRGRVHAWVRRRPV